MEEDAHSVRDKFKILLRRFSCACWPCMRANFRQCETREMIGFFKDGKYNNDFMSRLSRMGERLRIVCSDAV